MSCHMRHKENCNTLVLVKHRINIQIFVEDVYLVLNKTYFIFRREIVDLRGNTQQPMFQNVVSLAMASGVFYWTNGEVVLFEEYHPFHKSYFHTAYPDRPDKSFVSVSVNLPSSQPIPVPVNPPTNVQAILGPTLAKTSWQVPHLLGGQGDCMKEFNPFYFVSYHITSYHVSYHIYHIMYHIIYHIITYCIVSYHIIYFHSVDPNRIAKSICIWK